MGLDGQLALRKVSAGKNPAAMLTKHLPASTLHKILPKLGVRTRAADSRDLLSMLSLGPLVSSREVKSSFFIRMMAEQSVPAQLIPSSVANHPTKQRSSIDLAIFTESLSIGQLWTILILRGSVALCSKLCL